MITEEKENMIENDVIETDTYGIYMRDYEDTLVTRDIPNQYGYYNDQNEYIEHGTHTIVHYRYDHNPQELYDLNQNQPLLRLEGYEAGQFEQAFYKGIPMMYRWNTTIRNLMMTGNFRIKYRGCSKEAYGYRRPQGYCHAEYADTFALYPK